MPKAGKTKVAARSIKLIHPQSRKANRLGAREIHKERVKKVHQDTSLRNAVFNDKLMWFKDALDPDKHNYSKADAEELIQRYLQRFEEELEQISIVNSMKSRSGRQHATREDIINTTKQREEEQFTTCGIEIPDIIDGRNLKLFKAWDGNQRLFANIKMRRVVRTLADKMSNSSRPTGSRGEQNPDEDNGGEMNDIHDDADVDNDEGVEDDLLDSDVQDRDNESREGLIDEGVESH